MDEPWVELRVHGVSGTPPECLLDEPEVTQVDGDDRSRFFRATRPSDPVAGRTVEGFHWGRYTSGSWRQAFTLVLLPFGLINLAAFTLPAPARSADGSPTRLAASLRVVALGILRFFGVVTTILASLAVSLVLIEVFALRWVGPMPWAGDAAQEHASILGAAGAGALFLVLGGWSWFCRLARGIAEDEEPLRATPPVDDGDYQAPQYPQGGASTPFAARAFYSGDVDAAALRGLHLAAALLVPSALLLSLSHPPGWLRQAVFGLLLTVLVAVTVLGDREGAATTGATPAQGRLARCWRGTMASASVILVAAGVVALLATMLVASTGLEVLGQDGAYVEVSSADTKPFDQALTWLVAATVVALTLLVVVVAAQVHFAGRDRRGSPSWHFRPYCGGMCSVAIAALGIFTMAGYAAALVIGTSTALGTDIDHLQRLDGTVQLLDRIALAWGTALLPAVLIACGWLVLRWRSNRELHRLVALVFPDDSPYPRVRARVWRRNLAHAIWLARLKQGIPAGVWLFVGTGVAMSIFLLNAVIQHEFGDNDTACGFVLTSTTKCPDETLGQALIQVGTWLLLALIVTLVTLARAAFRDRGLRRAINTLWDVISFWPHATHPFVAAPYSQRAVADLAERVRHHLRTHPGDGRAVALCCHSQGSLIGFAALQLLSDEECRRVAFVTFGSQLRQMFPRAFPLYVSYDTIAATYGRLGGGWVNLYRDTDALAGPVLSWNHRVSPTGATFCESFPDVGAGQQAARVDHGGRVVRCGSDWRLVDPTPRTVRDQPGAINTIDGHSRYWSHPDWHAAVETARRAGRAGPADEVADDGAHHPTAPRRRTIQSTAGVVSPSSHASKKAVSSSPVSSSIHDQ